MSIRTPRLEQYTVEEGTIRVSLLSVHYEYNMIPSFLPSSHQRHASSKPIYPLIVRLPWRLATRLEHALYHKQTLHKYSIKGTHLDHFKSLPRLTLAIGNRHVG